MLAFFCWNYFFLPPYHALHVADTEDWLSLVAFLVAGIVMGAQTGRLREREARAVAREREAAAINRLSTYLVSEVSDGDGGGHAAGRDGAAAGGRARGALSPGR